MEILKRRIDDVFLENRADVVDQQERIDALITEEQDPKSRLTLMILSNINKSISANTGLTKAIHLEVRALKNELESHVTESDAVKNKADGAYKIIRIITPAIWAILCGAIALLYHNYAEFQEKVNDQLSHIQLTVKGVEDNLANHDAKELNLSPIYRSINSKEK